ncbi:alpha-L-fucosidase [Streptomyces cavernicola]|uniref:alpha-L-fucosidase n=1 Tax=Streptomyces cavernicola TaxID=3043613 RepID=A0ABT6S854_9ACTN|nr:alpha-L-fucosidase [Streptomyces sp. B-S-A6]MDI3404205.1 alpha-L-fucosidase [Streptomyces sp. B-S-A6]
MTVSLPEDSWFRSAGLGLFVHWDHASAQGLEVSWPMVGGAANLRHTTSTSIDRYRSTERTFDPDRFDARELARTARESGATYAVLTSRHHNGYAMWPTETSDRSVAHSRGKRDIVGEYVTAMRAEGLRVGLYYSLSDWNHPDYPAFTDARHPYLQPDKTWPWTPAQADRYRDYLRRQLTELLTWYGPLDVLWFDGEWERTADEWRTGELRELIRTLAPDCVVNDRLLGHGDYATPEQYIPAAPPDGPWEACLTMNTSWGHVPQDGDYKSAREILHTLAETVSKGGNLLLNVSPTGDGTLPAEQRERLAAIAGWMADHREAAVGVRPGLAPGMFYGPTTRRRHDDGSETLYLYLLAWPEEPIGVRDVPTRRVRSVDLVGVGELPWEERLAIADLELPDPSGELRVTLPTERPSDVLLPVVRVELGAAR